MRYLTIGLVLALTLLTAPIAAAGDPGQDKSGSSVVVEVAAEVLDWLKTALAEMGPAIEPNGAPETAPDEVSEEPEPPPAEIGAGIDPNG